MSLPALIEYAAPVPPLADLPVSRADWKLDPGRAAVLVHDMQRYFLRSYAPSCPALVGAIEGTARIIAAAREAGVPVFYTAQTGDQPLTQRGLQADLWGPGMSARPDDTTIIDPLAPRAGELVLEKHRYSAFARSDFAERLAAAGRDQLVVTGVYAHIGVTATALDSFMREIQPFVVGDAVADFGADQHRLALAQIASCAGVVTMTDDVVAAFAATPLTGWDAVVRAAFGEVLTDAFVESAFATPDADLFALGMNSLKAFDVLDRLAEAGVDIDFGDFTRQPTLRFVLAQGQAPAFVTS